MKLRNLFKKKPKQYFTYRMLCRNCDLIFTRTDHYANKCPMCGRNMEVYDATPLEGKIYDNRA